MAAAARPRPCVELDIHDDSLVLSDLPLGNIQNIQQGIRQSSVDSLVRQLDNLHLHCADKENKLLKPASRLETADEANCENVKPSAVGVSVVSQDPESKLCSPLQVNLY